MIEIRDARQDEFDELGDIRVAAYLADGFLSPQSTYAPRLRELGADGLDHVLVAVQWNGSSCGKIIGTVMLQGWPQGGEILAGPDEAEIRALAVSPEARGAGVGRALLAAVIERAASEGIRHLVLLTQTEMKAAHHLYDEAGFGRLPERDWSPEPGVTLLAYGLTLDLSSYESGCPVKVDRTRDEGAVMAVSEALPEVPAAGVPDEAWLLDVREDDEWAAGHVPSATHIPLGQLGARTAELPQDEQIYVICRSGMRSARAAQALNGAGWQAINVAGGMQDWAAAGRPMRTDSGAAPFVA